MNRFGYKAYTVEEATRKLERYCAYQERCHSEVVEQLRRMRMIPEAIDQIVVHLIQHEFLNETRFALAFVRGKFRQKGWGPLRLSAELRNKGVSENLISRSLDAISEDEYARRFQEVAARKADTLKGEDREKARQKLFHYLYYRGWEKDRIYGALREHFPSS